jgi:hypothetical protein
MKFRSLRLTLQSRFNPMKNKLINRLGQIVVSRRAALPTMTLRQQDVADDASGGAERTPAGFVLSARNCVWATSVVMLGLGLRFYYVRELVVTMFLFSLLFFSLALTVLSGFFAGYAGKRVAIWAGVASTNHDSAAGVLHRRV